MKKIEPSSSRSELDDVKERLLRSGVQGRTAYEVNRGFGRTGERRRYPRSSILTWLDFGPKVRVEIVVTEDIVRDVVEAYSRGPAPTDRRGRSSWTPVEKAIRIRTASAAKTPLLKGAGPDKVSLTGHQLIKGSNP